MDQVGERRVTGGQVRADARFVVFIIEPRGDGAAEQRKLASGLQATPLPNAARYEDLKLLARAKIGAENEGPPLPCLVELQHPYRISEVEMEDLIGP